MLSDFFISFLNIIIVDCIIFVVTQGHFPGKFVISFKEVKLNIFFVEIRYISYGIDSFFFII